MSAPGDVLKEWDKARKATGLDTIHLHDLRHAAGTLAAQTGATLRELQARLGHATPAAAQRYQHAATRRDTVIAVALEEVLAQHQELSAAAQIPLLRDTGGAGAFRAIVPPASITLEAASDQGVSESERRESNPRSQLGKRLSRFPTTRAFARSSRSAAILA
ncbi:MAG: tyrosine-type recombinase/integrase [Actinomycetota bacterium]|nr:tyrosine-type recombinase/integrase [Actinomycetota bacterium]